MAESKVRISTDVTRFDLSVVHGFLTKTYWAEGRTLEQVRTSIQHSVSFGVFLDGQQIGFARVVTDRVVFAYLMDFFIVADHRGKGYATMLLDHIFEDPRLRTVKKWLLATQDAHPFYAKFGFVPLEGSERMMSLVRDRSE